MSSELNVIPFPSHKSGVVDSEKLSKVLLIDKNNVSPKFNGPISGEMWKKVSVLNSSYTDTFDWSIYDQIYNRFKDEQPRGGVVFKTTFKLVNHHSSCSKCHYSFEIDTYGRGCIHNCVFCYAKDQLSSHGFWNRPIPFPVDLAEIRKTFYTVFETNQPHKWRKILAERVPLRIGSMSDSFMWIDQKYGVTKEVIKILNYYKYPYIIFTRSDLLAQDDYLSLLDSKLAAVQYSISGNNEEMTRQIEPGAPSVARRLKALKKISESGFWTTVRINPFFPTHPDGFFSDRDATLQRFGGENKIPQFPLFDYSFFDQLKEAKVPSVLAGFVRLSPKAINNISNVTKIDLKAFFKPELLAIQGDKRYSDKEIGAYYRQLHRASNEKGIRFNTCYIGNGLKDFFQYQDLWSNKSDCCDAKGFVPEFKKSSQSIEWQERIKHSPFKESAEQARVDEEKVGSIYSSGRTTILNQVENEFT